MLLNAGDDVDEMLSILIGLCKEEAYVYCNLPSYDTKLDFVVIQMVIERYNKMGTEGISKATSSGLTEEYMYDFSAPILKKLRKNRKVKCV